MIAEVSGLADILIVTVTLILGIFYTPFFHKSKLYEHMGPKVLTKKKRKPRKTPTTDKTGIKLLLLEMKNRFTLKLSVWFLIFYEFVPSMCRSKKVNKVFEIADKSRQRIDDALDIKRLVESQEDLIHFMKHFMGWKQYWLFKRQRDRFITFGKVNPIQ